MSTISLLLSLYSIWRTRKNVTVEFAPNIQECNLNSIYAFNDKNEKCFFHIAYLTNIEIVNSSTTDISFFDLRVFNPKTNINVDFVTKRTIKDTFPSKKIYTDYIDNRYYELDIPERRFGTIPANSFLRMDIVVDLNNLIKQNENLDTLAISFKIPKKVFLKRDPFAVTNRKKFKYFGIQYSISGWKERRKQQELELVAKEELSKQYKQEQSKQ